MALEHRGADGGEIEVILDDQDLERPVAQADRPPGRVEQRPLVQRLLEPVRDRAARGVGLGYREHAQAHDRDGIVSGWHLSAAAVSQPLVPGISRSSRIASGVEVGALNEQEAHEGGRSTKVLIALIGRSVRSRLSRICPRPRCVCARRPLRAVVDSLDQHLESVTGPGTTRTTGGRRLRAETSSVWSARRHGALGVDVRTIVPTTIGCEGEATVGGTRGRFCGARWPCLVHNVGQENAPCHFGSFRPLLLVHRRNIARSAFDGRLRPSPPVSPSSA